MIAGLIGLCVRNRGMVLLLTLFLVVGGIWSIFHVTVDAIPDLSDVQVILRTEYPGQAPRIIEDQITYPLTTAMLSVPRAQSVRGYSMFGTSFVYIIFQDGTDLYWARSRVLEQLSVVTARLPQGVTPQLGPDATSVGWVYEYVLTTGPYCPKHPNGLWYDPQAEAWYARPADAPPGEATQKRLVLRRAFPESRAIYLDPQNHHRYETPDLAPAEARGRLQRVVLRRGYDRCPLDGSPLVPCQQTLADLRSIQDWTLRYELIATGGVSDVAPLGGFVKQYQIVLDPVKLQAYDMPLAKVRMAIHRSNIDVGGRIIEMSETEYMVRGMGYLGTMTDEEVAEAQKAGQSVGEIRTRRVVEELGKVSLGANATGTPVYLRDIAHVHTGPEIRRNVTDWNGEGEVVGGIVLMRFGENARTTILGVRQRLRELEATLPPGVAVEVAYDRSGLIERAIHTLTRTLIEEITIVSLICVLFLLHARSALVAAFVLPAGVLACLTLMYVGGINANIMSLGGIAIAIGVMVDSSIIMVENAHKHIEREKEAVAGGQTARSHALIIGDAAREVGPSLFFALLIITVAFLPVFALGQQSGRLFRPLAFTKTFAMASAAFLAVTIVPVLMVYFVGERVVPRSLSLSKRLLVYGATILLPAVLLAVIPMPMLGDHRWSLVVGWVVLASLIILPQRILPEARNPISRVLEWLYQPVFRLVMRLRVLVLLVAVAVVAVTVWPFLQLGSEFMPPLEEGDLLFMPVTDPGLSITKARQLLQQTDKILSQFPEIESVFGKMGRAETATDPAPLSMMETTISLRRDQRQWRHVPVRHFFDGWPGWARWLPSRLWPSERAITQDELVYGFDQPDGTHAAGLNELLQFPGVANAWTMPIKTRIDMLSTGIRTPVGIKVVGPNLKTLSDLAAQIAQTLTMDPTTAPFTTSAYPEKSVGGNYLDIRIDRDEIARYGLSVADVQDVIKTALGGMDISQTVEGLERYPINARYERELRDDPAHLKQTLVFTPTGAQVPLGQLAAFVTHQGPPMIKSENSRPSSWIFVDIAGIDIGTYVVNAQRAVGQAVSLPTGYSLIWSGQFQYMEEARRRLLIVMPIAGVLIILLLYLATRSWVRVAIVLLAVPFSIVGAVWLLYLLGYHLSVAVWVGIIALAGLDAETGIVMLLYLENSFERFKAEGKMRTHEDLWAAVHDGAVKRIRPKTMTVAAAFTGLVPLLWATGAGADTMRRLAAPMIGGLITSFIMELLIYPVVFYSLKRIAMRWGSRSAAQPTG